MADTLVVSSRKLRKHVKGQLQRPSRENDFVTDLKIELEKVYNRSEHHHLFTGLASSGSSGSAVVSNMR